MRARAVAWLMPRLRGWILARPPERFGAAALDHHGCTRPPRRTACTRRGDHARLRLDRQPVRGVATRRARGVQHRRTPAPRADRNSVPDRARSRYAPCSAVPRMLTSTASQRFAELATKELFDDYNFEHFRAKHLVRDAKRTVRNHGILPGELAPDFELPRVGGGTLRLTDLRGRPVLLHFGSFTCPITTGSVEPLRKL